MKKEDLTYSKTNFYEKCDEAEIKAAYDYCVGYAEYMDNSKTEREAVKTSIALAAYNCGEGNVSEWLTDPKYSEDGVKLNVSKIPNEFRETKNYVKKVNKALKHYSELYK